MPAGCTAGVRTGSCRQYGRRSTCLDPLSMRFQSIHPSLGVGLAADPIALSAMIAPAARIELPRVVDVFSLAMSNLSFDPWLNAGSGVGAPGRLHAAEQRAPGLMGWQAVAACRPRLRPRHEQSDRFGCAPWHQDVKPRGNPPSLDQTPRMRSRPALWEDLTMTSGTFLPGIARAGGAQHFLSRSPAVATLIFISRRALNGDDRAFDRHSGN